MQELQHKAEAAPRDGRAGGAGGGGSEDGDVGDDEFSDKTKFFATNDAHRNASGDGGAGVQAMLAEIGRLRRAVSDEQASSAMLRSRLRMLETGAGASSNGGVNAPPLSRGAEAGDDGDELTRLRAENDELANDLDAAQADADAAAATARLVGAQLERARTVLLSEQAARRGAEAAADQQRVKAVALARLMRVHVQAASSGKPVDWAALDAMAAAATAPVVVQIEAPLSDGAVEASIDTDHSVDEEDVVAMPPARGAAVATATHGKPDPNAAAMPASGWAHQYKALKGSFEALQRKHEALRHSEALLCAALSAAHAALDHAGENNRSGGQHRGSGAITPSPAQSPRSARRVSSAAGTATFFPSGASLREEALTAALHSEKAAAAAAEAHLQRELADAQKAATALSYELAALKSSMQRHSDGGQDDAGRMDADGGQQQNGHAGVSDDSAHLKRQLASARAEVRDLGAALRLALTSGVKEYAAALSSTGDAFAATTDDTHGSGESASHVLKAALAKYLATIGGGGRESSSQNGGGVDSPTSASRSATPHALATSLSDVATLDAARREAADAEARAIAAEATAVMLRRQLEELGGGQAAGVPVVSIGAPVAQESVSVVAEAVVAVAHHPLPMETGQQSEEAQDSEDEASSQPPVAPPPAPAADFVPNVAPSAPVVLKAKPLPRVWPKQAAASDADAAPAGGDGGDAAAGMPQLRIKTRQERWAAQTN